MSNNYAIYGPPAHYLNRIDLTIDEDTSSNVWKVSMRGFSSTHVGSIWQVAEDWPIDGSDNDALVLASRVQLMMEDFWRDRPGTQPRAQFVMSGGLYEQLPLF